MLDLTLIDALILLYLLFRIVRARSRTLGDALHDLIALAFLIALILGFRLAGEVRGVLSGVADMMRAIPGLGSRLLIVIAAWYLLRLVRTHTGHWLGSTVPSRLHGRLLPVVEALRGLLLVGFLVWLVEGAFARPPAKVPKVVQWVRATDAWVTGLGRPPPHGPPTPPPMRWR